MGRLWELRAHLLSLPAREAQLSEVSETFVQKMSNKAVLNVKVILCKGSDAVVHHKNA